MIINGERALAYVVTIDEIKPIEGYDRVEYARTNGWWVIISKEDNLKVGDKCVYFEIDSKVPSTDKRFEFLEKRHYKIKTQKMCKVISQGLLMPLSKFPELGDLDINTDVTNKLGVIYSVKEDNYRKKINPNAKYNSMAARHARLFKKKPFKWLMRRSWGRKLLFAFFGKKNDKPLQFPSFLKKTDEERIENLPFKVGLDTTYILTEKLDGTSCTYALKRKRRNKYEYFICSRNRRILSVDQDCYHDTNIYYELSDKYNIEEVLRNYIETLDNAEWVCIQGEGVGNVQGNPLKLEENDLYVFNLINSNDGRLGSIEGKELIESWNMKWVPILGEGQLQNTMEEVKEFADGKSAINPNVNREGIVYRSIDGKTSFKNVSRKYLLKAKD